VMLPATALAGVALPAVLAVAAGDDAGPRDSVGRLLAWNLLGSAVGPAVVAFAVVPVAGLWWSTGIVGLLLVATAAQAALSVAPPRMLRFAAWAVVTIVLTRTLNAVPRVRLETGDRLVDLRDGALATVAVVE